MRGKPVYYEKNEFTPEFYAVRFEDGRMITLGSSSVKWSLLKMFPDATILQRIEWLTRR